VSGFNECKDAAIFVCKCCAFFLFGVVAVFWNGGDGRPNVLIGDGMKNILSTSNKTHPFTKSSAASKTDCDQAQRLFLYIFQYRNAILLAPAQLSKILFKGASPMIGISIYVAM